MSTPIVNNPYPFEPFIRQLAVEQKVSMSSALSEKVQSVSEKHLEKSEESSSPNSGFVFDALPYQDKISLLTFFDLPELAEFSRTSKAANALVSDFQIWSSIAKRINCLIDKNSHQPLFKQVLDFIRRIQNEAAAIDNRPDDITQSLKGPTIDQINTIQQWLQARMGLINWRRLVEWLNQEFRRLNLEGSGAIEDLTTQETIAKWRLYPKWYNKNLPLLKARDTLIIWRKLAASANLPGPNLQRIDTEEDIITRSGEFDAWVNANQTELLQLTALGLCSMHLTSLPEQISQLCNLENLDLQFNQLTSLPEQIRQLSHLEKLCLSFNQLTAIPEQIGQLSQLRELDLSFNQLTAIPEWIGQFSRLENLDLSQNKLTSLPEQIGQLSHLESLDLGINKLTSLPEQIGQLSNLEKLDLRFNRLTSLPEQIGQLSKLKNLNLISNILTSLPEKIGQLSNLESLDLQFNQLPAKPERIGQLSKLKKLIFFDNKLISIPE